MDDQQSRMSIDVVDRAYSASSASFSVRLGRIAAVTSSESGR